VEDLAFSCCFYFFHEKHEKSRKSTKKQTRGFSDVGNTFGKVNKAGFAQGKCLGMEGPLEPQPPPVTILP